MTAKEAIENDPFESVTDRSETAQEFLQKLDLADDRWHRNGLWIFRGQNNANWELEPSLFRDWDEDTVPGYEQRLIDSFIHTANMTGLKIPPNSLGYSSFMVDNVGGPATQRLTGTTSGVRRGTQYDFAHVVFAIAQHSGIPTRLLDFTYDPLIAAHFAADWTGLMDSLEISPQYLGKYFMDIYNRSCHSPEEALMAWAEHSENVSARIAELPKEMAVWALSVVDLVETSLRILDHPYGEILNLSSQKGVFLCETENYEVKGEPWRSFNGKLSQLVESGGIYKLTLPCTERKILQEILGRKRISSLYLKPTYEAIAKVVREVSKQK